MFSLLSQNKAINISSDIKIYTIHNNYKILFMSYSAGFNDIFGDTLEQPEKPVI